MREAPKARFSLPPTIDSQPPLELVLFDAGHTLIRDTTPPGQIALAVLRSHGVHVERSVAASVMAGAMADVSDQWHSGDWWRSERTVRTLFTSNYRKHVAELDGLRDRQADVAPIADDIYDTYQDPSHWGAFDDVPATLTRLAEAGLRMGIVSDWGHGLEAILLELDVGAHMEFLVASARLGVAKPDPRVFEFALERANVAADRCVYIGDTYVKDIMGARAAGIAAVLLDRRRDMPPVDCPVVHDLFGLLRLLGVPASSRVAHVA